MTPLRVDISYTVLVRVHRKLHISFKLSTLSVLPVLLPKYEVPSTQYTLQADNAGSSQSASTGTTSTVAVSLIPASLFLSCSHKAK